MITCTLGEFQSTLPARGATSKPPKTSGGFEISIHAPRTGSDDRAAQHQQKCNLISIHAPRTGSDTAPRICTSASKNFNPRSPHGERRDFVDVIGQVADISIHAPRTGSDRIAHHPNPAFFISIHAPRTGSDRGRRRLRPHGGDFNPRSPHGERPGDPQKIQQAKEFQSTLPARGATFERRVSLEDAKAFQSTLPARGATGADGG